MFPYQYSVILILNVIGNIGNWEKIWRPIFKNPQFVNWEKIGKYTLHQKRFSNPKFKCHGELRKIGKYTLDQYSKIPNLYVIGNW
jgi:hypothetical protein